MCMQKQPVSLLPLDSAIAQSEVWSEWNAQQITESKRKKRLHFLAAIRHFLLQAPQCPCTVRKRFSRGHCCRGRSKPGCWFVGHTPGESWPPEPELTSYTDWLAVTGLLARSRERWTARVPYVSRVFTWVLLLLHETSHWSVAVCLSVCPSVSLLSTCCCEYMPWSS